MSSRSTGTTRTGLGAIDSERFDAMAAVGGWRGVLESVVPTLVFVLVMNAMAQRTVGAGAALKPIVRLYVIATFLASVVAVAFSFAFPSTLHLVVADATVTPPSGIIEVVHNLILNVKTDIISQNVADFATQVKTYLVGINTVLKTDDDFAQAEADCKDLKAIEDNTRAAILAVCDNQSEAAILGKSGAWYRVRLALRPNQPAERRIINGYVHQSQVSLRHVYTVHSADGSANLRLNANSRAEIQQRIPNGTTVTEHPAKRQGDWHYVSVHGSDSDTYGYVHKSQLRPKAGR